MHAPCTFCGRTDCHACKSELRFRVIEILNALETEIAKDCKPDETGIVTNHMRAAWGARDLINELLETDRADMLAHGVKMGEP